MQVEMIKLGQHCEHCENNVNAKNEKNSLHMEDQYGRPGLTSC